jgi:hypothetical protein
MDYCLDAGDGTATIWTGQQDVDLDAVDPGQPARPVSVHLT